MRYRYLIFACLGATLAAWPAFAHHSHVNYAVAEFTHLEGVVKELHRLNPHSWVYIEVRNEQGESQIWALEATGPNGLLKQGIKPEDVRTGDKVRVRCHALRDGSPGCLLGFVAPMHGYTARGHGVEKEWD